MSTLDLRAKYGGSRAGRNLVNEAIRAELVGGDECLDALAALDELLHEWKQRGWRDQRAEIESARELVAGVARSMRAEIRRRYQMPPERD